MANTFRKTDSIQYALTKWFDEIQNIQKQYLGYFNKTLQACKTNILEVALDLQKKQGKSITKETLNKKDILIKNAFKIEPEILELVEFVHNFKTLIEEVDGFELDLKSTKILQKLIKSDLMNLEELTISLRNLIKAINVVFISDSKPIKKNESEFNNYLKDLTKVVQKIDKEFSNLSQEFNSLIIELKNEVDTVKKLGEQKIM